MHETRYTVDPVTGELVDPETGEAGAGGCPVVGEEVATAVVAGTAALGMARAREEAKGREG